MIIVLSPAKSLNFEPPQVNAPASMRELGGDVAELAAVTRKLKRADLKRLMEISDALADLNYERFQTFDPDSDDGLQAAFAFDGDVYAGLDARTLDRKALSWAQDHIRILSGLYGVLRPLDLIQPYRLEMGIRLKTKRGATLYDFWRRRVTEALNRAGQDQADPTLVNCASQEYFGAVDPAGLKLPLVACHFREVKDGESRIVSFYAKKARGLMARYAVDQRINRADSLKGFDLEGYAFQPKQSSDKDWVFERPQPPPKR